MNNKGIITTYALVFGAVFLILLGGLLNFILNQLKHSAQKVAWSESSEIAESGINYYRWCLNNEVQDQCATEKEYLDLDGNPIGKFSLKVETQTTCGEVTQTEITSRGWTYDFPDLDRELKARYGRASVAKYAYLLDDQVWAGADREIRGLYHSNGGIRMDGENQSLVTSAKQTWLCTDSFGCDPGDCPSDCTKEGDACSCPGVFTTTDNSNPDLFDFPVTSFDFEGITVDLAHIKDLVEPYPQQNYWPPVTDIDGEGEGYHLKFKNDGTFEVWIITKLDSTLAYSLEQGWHQDYFIIEDQYLYQTVDIDPQCALIFVEDNLWLEGEVKGKVTVASANLVTPTKDTTVVLPDDIDYTVLDGSDGLGVIAEDNILIGPDSPNQMELRGIFVAQKGHFGRNHYPWNIKDKLEISGSIVSNGRVGTKWSSWGHIISGYRKRENYIDSNLVYSPPPFIPHISSNFRIAEWGEVK